MKKLGLWSIFTFALLQSAWASSYVENKVLEIRAEFQETNTYKHYKVKKTTDSDHGENYVETKFFLRDGEVRKIVRVVRSGAYDLIEEYYVKDNQLYFLYTVFNGASNEYSNQKERYYFNEENELIRYIDDKNRIYDLGRIPHDNIHSAKIKQDMFISLISSVSGQRQAPRQSRNTNSNNSHVESLVQQIRKDFQQTNAYKNYQTIEDDNGGVGDAQTIYFLRDGEVRKIVAVHFGGGVENKTEFYAKNNQLYFAYVTMTSFSDMGHQTGIQEQRFYFNEQNELIRYIGPNKKVHDLGHISSEAIQSAQQKQEEFSHLISSVSGQRQAPRQSRNRNSNRNSNHDYVESMVQQIRQDYQQTKREEKTYQEVHDGNSSYTATASFKGNELKVLHESVFDWSTHTQYIKESYFKNNQLYFIFLVEKKDKKKDKEKRFYFDENGTLIRYINEKKKTYNLGNIPHSNLQEATENQKDAEERLNHFHDIREL